MNDVTGGIVKGKREKERKLRRKERKGELRKDRMRKQNKM